MNDFQQRVLKAILYKLVVDAGGELVLGELEIDPDGENGIVVDFDKGLMTVTALPDYISVGKDDAVPAADFEGIPPGEFLEELEKIREGIKNKTLPIQPMRVNTGTTGGWATTSTTPIVRTGNSSTSTPYTVGSIEFSVPWTGTVASGTTAAAWDRYRAHRSWLDEQPSASTSKASLKAAAQKKKQPVSTERKQAIMASYDEWRKKVLSDKSQTG